MNPTFTKQLSARLTDGKKQVLVRILLTRTHRICVKSGIFVHPSYFSGGDIITSKRGRRNEVELQNAIAACNSLNIFCQKITNLVNIARPHFDNIEKSWLDLALDLDRKGEIDLMDQSLDFDTIRKAMMQKTCPSVLFSGQPGSNITKESVSSKSIYEFFDIYCSTHKIAHSREVNYKTLKSILYRYEQYEQLVTNRKDFKFIPEVITSNDVLSFRNYMMYEKDLLSKCPSQFEVIIENHNKVFPRQRTMSKWYGINNKSENYIIGMMKKLRGIQKWLREALHVTLNNPFLGMNIGVEQRISHPIYMSKDERNRLAAYDFTGNPRLARQRDIFIFQCMTGCRYEDLRALNPDNVIGNVLEYIPLKTRRNALPAQPRVPLTADSLKTISRYAGVSKDNKLLPCTSVTTYNSDLKEMFKVCGLDRKVFVLDAKSGQEVQKSLYEVASSHLARRTFIGISYKMTKDPNIIATMSGHAEGSRAFDRYRDIDDEIRKEVIDLIK